MIDLLYIVCDAGGYTLYKFRCGGCGKLLFKFSGDINKIVIKCAKCKQENVLTTAEARPPKVIEQIIYISKNQ